MPRSASLTVLALFLAAGLGVWLFRGPGRAPEQGLGAVEDAFAAVYLNAAPGAAGSPTRACAKCHGPGDVYDAVIWKRLADQSRLGRARWAEDLALGARCGGCHVVPDPATLPSRSWGEVIGRMEEIIAARQAAAYPEEAWRELRHFYYTFSRAAQPALPPDPAPRHSPVRFEPTVFGLPRGERDLPFIADLLCVDLDQDGRLDVLACDTGGGSVNWVREAGGRWQEEVLAEVPFPSRAAVCTNTSNGRLNIVAACQTVMAPTDDPVGSVVLLINDGAMRFTPFTILDQFTRVADVQPADLNGDGQVDFLVAGFGFITSGEAGWLEHTENGYRYRLIVKRSGAVRTIPADLNGDGRTDFVALFAQEHEQVSAFLNNGDGTFHEKTLFRAATPSFGSSGISLVDLDQDGDLDVLYTNGDNMDLPAILPRAFHGVQWLENRGNLEFQWHDVRRFYGAYAAVAGDLNGDGHLDIAVAGMFNDWSDPGRASLIWLENDGRQNFRAHGLATEPIYLITAALGDLDRDGRPDLLAGSMNIFAPFATSRLGRITLWKNAGPAGISLRPGPDQE